MRNILTIILASLAVAGSAYAGTADPGQPAVKTPTVTLTRNQHGFTYQTPYQLQEGDAAKIVYTIRRHRTDRAGFKTVGRILSVVAAGDGLDTGILAWRKIGGRRFGVGYRVIAKITDVSTGLSDAAVPAKIKL